MLHEPLLSARFKLPGLPWGEVSHYKDGLAAVWQLSQGCVGEAAFGEDSSWWEGDSSESW